MIRYFSLRIIAFLLGFVVLTIFIGSKGFSTYIGADAPVALLTHAWAIDISEKHRIAYLAGWVVPPLLFIVVIGLFLIPPPSTHGTARWSYKFERQLAGLHSPHGLILARMGHTFLRAAGNTHVALFAPPRDGKGVGVVVPNALTWPGSFITIDVKLEAWAVTAGYRSRFSECFLYAPGTLNTCSYNSLDAVRRDPIFRIGDIQRTSTIMFPPPRGSQDPMWMSECRNFFMATVLYLMDIGDEVSMPRARQFMNKQSFDPDEVKLMLAAMDLDEIAAENFIKFANMPAKQRSGVLSTASPMLEIFADPLIAACSRKTDFSISELRTHRQSIYIGILPGEFRRLSLLLNLVLQQISFTMVKDLADAQTGYQTLFLLDEFTAPGPMPDIIDGSAFYPGFNLRLMIVAQSPSQIRATYDQDDLDRLMANMDHRILYQPNSLKDAEDISNELGNRTVKTKSVSRGRGGTSVSHGHASRALLTPDEVKRLGDDNAIILVKGRRPTLATKIKFYKDKRLKKRANLPVPHVPMLDVSSTIQFYTPPLNEPDNAEDVIENVETAFSIGA